MVLAWSDITAYLHNRKLPPAFGYDTTSIGRVYPHNVGIITFFTLGVN